jgi:hypothetical protein
VDFEVTDETVIRYFAFDTEIKEWEQWDIASLTYGYPESL